MPVLVIGHLDRMPLQDVPSGRMFLMEHGEGRLVCMRGPDHVVVFGGRCTEDNSPGYVDPKYHLDTQVELLPEEIEIELCPGSDVDFGLALASPRAENGSITVGSDKSAWIYAQAEKGRATYFSLSDGQVGSPNIPRTHYAHWRLLWRKPGVREPIEIYRHG